MSILDCLKKYLCCCFPHKKRPQKKLELIYSTGDNALHSRQVKLLPGSLVAIPSNALRGPNIKWAQGSKSGICKVRHACPQQLTLTLKGWRKYLPFKPVAPTSVIDIWYQTQDGIIKSDITHKLAISVDGKHITLPDDAPLVQEVLCLAPDSNVATRHYIRSGQKFLKVEDDN